MDVSDADSSPASARSNNAWIKGALIGAGSIGTVYLAMNASSGLLMAVKQVEIKLLAARRGTVLELDQIEVRATGTRRRLSLATADALEREIERLKSVEHENVISYLYATRNEDSDPNFLNIFMEYIAGGSVSALLRNYGAFEEPLVKNFTLPILRGLEYLHGMGVIHRNIKSSNILVTNTGDVKISDFGMSEFRKVNTGNSAYCMAPETVKNSAIITHKADIWSTGCLFIEMLSGKHPWADLTPLQAIFQIGSGAIPTIPPGISAELMDFLKQTFRIDQEARPGADELLLHAWIKDTGDTTR